MKIKHILVGILSIIALIACDMLKSDKGAEEIHTLQDVELRLLRRRPHFFLNPNVENEELLVEPTADDPVMHPKKSVDDLMSWILYSLPPGMI